MSSTPLRIAIDCRTVLSPKTGDRTYTLNLLRGLAALDGHSGPPACRPWTFEILLDRPAPAGLIPKSECFHEVIINARNSRLWTLWDMPRWARNNPPSLIHLQYLGAPGLPCPFVTTIHDVVWYALPDTFPARDRLVLNRFMPATVRTAAGIITVSNFSAHEILRYLPASKGKVSVTYNAVDADFFASSTLEQIVKVRSRYGLGDEPYVLSVGVLQPRKNVPRLIEAFRQVKTAHPDWPHALVIAGKPGWGPDAQLAAQNPDIRFTGYVADADMPALYAGATVFAYPSLYEGFGLPVIEAQCAGTPVLTSNCSSLAEVARDTAQLVDPQSVDSIAKGLEELLSSSALRAKFAAAGKINAGTFDVEQQAKTTLIAYCKALQLPPGA